ncbi:MAG: ribbon-helix-helix protein, CopG family [Armatimonadetes bacterium]|nr:ribbon-helix-helix protein, CopG family [Armatimonadota bacterium]
MPKITDNSNRRVAVNISLSVGLLEHLDALAATEGLSRSAYIRAAIERAMEDADDIAVSEARLKDESDPWVSWEQVKAEAGL